MDVRDLGGHLDFTRRAQAGTLSKRIGEAILGVAAVGALPLGFQVKFGLVRGKYPPAGLHAAEASYVSSSSVSALRVAIVWAGKHVQVHCFLMFRIQGIQRRGDGIYCAPSSDGEGGEVGVLRNLFPRKLGDVLHLRKPGTCLRREQAYGCSSWSVQRKGPVHRHWFIFISYIVHMHG